MKLVLLTLILTLFSILFLGCVKQNKNSKQIKDDNLGEFSLPLPQNWLDKSDLNLKKNLSKYNFDDDELKAILKSNRGSIPVLVYLKYDPSTYSGPIPTIQVNLRPNQQLDFARFKNDMKVSMEKMGANFNNYRVLEPLEEITVDNVKGLKFKVQFDLESQEGEAWTIRSWSYVFPIGRYFYQINFSDNEGENCEALYEELIKKVKIK